MKWTLPLLIVVTLTSCTDTKHNEVGQFVYVDCLNTIHTDRECASQLAKEPKTKEERIMAAKGGVFIDTCKLIESTSIMPSVYPITFCPRCIDDEAYKHLSEIISRNEKQPQ